MLKSKAKYSPIEMIFLIVFILHTFCLKSVQLSEDGLNYLLSVVAMIVGRVLRSVVVTIPKMHPFVSPSIHPSVCLPVFATDHIFNRKH